MAVDQPRMTAQTLKVLGAFLSSHRDEPGVEIGRAAKLSSGTLYPILHRLERAGLLDSRWEVEDPRSLGRPRQRFYRLTGVGARRAKTAFRELEPAFRSLAWAG
jgi:PadR family transcriptional regulator, regulatory protein PadR